MPRSAYRPSSLPLIAALAALLAAVCLVISYRGNHSTPTVQAQTDTWRRTADGWERMETWPTYVVREGATAGSSSSGMPPRVVRGGATAGLSSSEMPTPVVRRSPDPAPPLTAGLPAPASQRHPRLDTHPAALTLFQIIAILLAFNAFPRHKCTDQAKPRDPWHSKLHRSFRASAFGD